MNLLQYGTRFHRSHDPQTKQNKTDMRHAQTPNGDQEQTWSNKTGHEKRNSDRTPGLRGMAGNDTWQLQATKTTI